MAMKFTDAYVEVIGERTFTLTISDADILRAKLDDFDRELLADCNKGDATISDKLLGLETLVRRIEEAEQTPVNPDQGYWTPAV